MPESADRSGAELILSLLLWTCLSQASAHAGERPASALRFYLIADKTLSDKDKGEAFAAAREVNLYFRTLPIFQHTSHSFRLIFVRSDSQMTTDSLGPIQDDSVVEFGGTDGHLSNVYYIWDNLLKTYASPRLHLFESLAGFIFELQNAESTDVYVQRLNVFLGMVEAARQLSVSPVASRLTKAEQNELAPHIESFIKNVSKFQEAHAPGPGVDCRALLRRLHN